MKQLVKKITMVGSIASLLMTTGALAAKQDWNYSSGEKGASQWHKTYPACQQGMQSPIDIPSKLKANSKLPSLEFVFTPTPAKVIDTGYAVQASMLNASDTLSVGSSSYALTQFHFHMPSENHIAGSSYPAEVHLVYKNKQGKLAVVGIFIKAGAPNATLAAFIQAINKEKHLGKQATARVTSKNKAGKINSGPVINANDLLPSDSNTYYGFTGSLTVPPCTHDIQWYLLANPITASAAQLKSLKAFYHGNARPTQPINGRQIDYRPSATTSKS